MVWLIRIIFPFRFPLTEQLPLQPVLLIIGHPLGPALAEPIYFAYLSSDLIEEP
jgi:hypothetical protein